MLLTAIYESTIRKDHIFFIFYGKNGYAKALRLYVTLKMGVLLTYLEKFCKNSFTFLHTKLKSSSCYFLRMFVDNKNGYKYVIENISRFLSMTFVLKLLSGVCLGKYNNKYLTTLHVFKHDNLYEFLHFNFSELK